jgi:ADP-ribose pyrophosphatase YjhB (NUDIX family)
VPSSRDCGRRTILRDPRSHRRPRLKIVTEDFDYHGALVVVETENDELVFIHPLGGPVEAPASLPSDPCLPGESPPNGAVRIVKEKTGLDVAITREFITFRQEGTPAGTMLAHGYIAKILGGELLADGPEGAAKAYSIRELPEIVPVRVANRRTLDAYLLQRSASHDDAVRDRPFFT